MLQELSQIGIKIEATEGTYSDPEAADAKVLARNATYEVIAPKTEREVRTADLDQFPSVGTAIGARVSFELDLYAIDQTNLPAFRAALQACGLSTATGGGGSAAHVMGLASMVADIPSVSIALNVNGYRRKLSGARGNAVMRFKSGAPIACVCTFTGQYEAPTDTALLAVTYDTNARDLPTFVGAALALTAVSPATATLSAAECILETCEIDLGNEVTLRSDANAANGYRAARITKRGPMLRIDPEQMTVAAWPALEQLRQDYEFAFTTGLLSGKATKNNLKFDAPRAHLVGVREVNRGGILVAALEFELCRASGNDSLTLTLST